MKQKRLELINKLINKFSADKIHYMASFSQMNYLLANRHLRKNLVKKGIVTFERSSFGPMIVRVNNTWVATLSGVDNEALVRAIFDTVIAMGGYE